MNKTERESVTKAIADNPKICKLIADPRFEQALLKLKATSRVQNEGLTSAIEIAIESARIAQTVDTIRNLTDTQQQIEGGNEEDK